MLESRRLGTARQRNVDFMRNLGGNLVVSEGRDEADHSGGNLQRDGYEVGIAERREVCQTVEAATKLFDDALVAHVVQCARVDSSTQRGTGAEQTATSAEGSFFLFEGMDNITSNYSIYAGILILASSQAKSLAGISDLT